MPSFTLIGYEARSRLFDWKPLDGYDLTDRTIVLTGGSSGLGYAAAEAFAELGATRESEQEARDRLEADRCDGAKAEREQQPPAEVISLHNDH